MQHDNSGVSALLYLQGLGCRLPSSQAIYGIHKDAMLLCNLQHTALFVLMPNITSMLIEGNPLWRSQLALSSKLAPTDIHCIDFDRCLQTFILTIMASDAGAFMYWQLQLLQSRLRNSVGFGHKGLRICTL